MKKLFISLLALLGCMVVHASSFSKNGLYYNITGNNTVEVTYNGYTGLYSGDIEIPSQVRNGAVDYTVTSIGNSAFSGCSSLTSVTIPNSVTSIGNSAFSNCSGLPSVTIPSSVTSIGNQAFSNCSGLPSVTIPNSVTSIGFSAFSYCSGLTSVTIGNSVTSIGDNVFSNCSGLTSVTIGNSVTSIGSSAFSYCSKLTSVTIPGSVTSIGNSAFQTCSNLTSVTIPSSMTSIGAGAFYGCRKLTSVTIPSSVTSIGNQAFSDCSGLTSINVDNGNTVYDSRNNCNAIIKTETNELIFGCKNTIIPNSVTSIGSKAFYNCGDLTSVTIPSSVTSIGSQAFRSCSGLTSITIPGSVTSMGDNAFSYCDKLTSVTIGNSVTSIGNSAFHGCSSLTSVTIPNSVTSIGSSAFTLCSNLPSVTIPSSVTSIGSDAFSYCGKLTSVIVEASTPVTITSSVFTYRSNATLYVPAGSKTAYEAANYWNDFGTIVEMGNEITIGLAGMGTFCSTHPLDFSGTDDIKAYIVSAFKPSTGEVILTRITDVPANTGIVVKGNADTYAIPWGAGETVVANMLVGVTVDTQLNKVDGDYTNYILANKGGNLGFYAVSDGSTLSAGKAYLPLPTAQLPSVSGAPQMTMIFDDDETTGIQQIQSDVKSNGDYYDLQGRRVLTPTRGLYIVNGKKVFIK